MKRLFDLLVSFVGIVLLLPFFLLIGLAIKVSDGGDILFFQSRVGRGGCQFRMWKFRTMVMNAESMGKSITIGRDPRITRIGHLLRDTKLDELPQLFNVLLGDMSFVGPRPEVKRYTDLYSERQKKVLELQPGITDPASLKYRHESTLLAEVEDPELYYIQEIMPDKISINLDYASRSNLLTDLAIILQTVGIYRPR